MKEFNQFIATLERCLGNREAFIGVLSHAAAGYGFTLTAQYAFDHWIATIRENNKASDTYLAYESMRNAAGQLAELRRCEQEGIDLLVDSAGGDRANPMLRETFTTLLHRKLQLHTQIPPELREDIALVDKLGEAILSMDGKSSNSQQIRASYYRLLERYYSVEQKISRSMGVKEAESVLISLAMVKAETRRIIETVREQFFRRDVQKLAKAESKSRSLGQRVQQAMYEISPGKVIHDMQRTVDNLHKQQETEIVDPAGKVPLSGNISVIAAFGLPWPLTVQRDPHSGKHKLN